MFRIGVLFFIDVNGVVKYLRRRDAAVRVKSYVIALLTCQRN